MTLQLPLLDGVEPLLERYDHFILDIWGVLHDGMQVYDGVNAALQMFRLAGKQVGLLSNSPNRSAVIRDDLMHHKGVIGTYDHILTSGDSSYRALKDYEGSSVYCIWDEENPTCLEGLSITRVPTPDEADIVLVSLLPRNAKTEDYMDIVRHMANLKLPMICANADLIVNVGRDLCLCAGAIAEAYEALGGAVSWHGKPHTEVYSELFDMMGAPDKTRLCAIGDSLRTDIQGGGAFGIDTVWNLVGIHAAELHRGNEMDVSAVRAAMDEWTYAPNWIMTGLRP